MQLIGIDFYKGEDVVKIARQLLGKLLVTRFAEGETAVRIVETEAYFAPHDRASHAYNYRRTPKNEMMYAEAGTSYVYICYGIHRLFNVVTNITGIPHAVLVRAGEPVTGTPIMLRRRKKAIITPALTRGPGSMAGALGINMEHNGYFLPDGKKIGIYDDGFILPETLLGISKRIGIEGAGEEAVNLPYRFYIKGNRYVSGHPVN